MANTRAVWEPKYGHPLSDDEVIEILVLWGRLLDVLLPDISVVNPAGMMVTEKTRASRRATTPRPRRTM